MLLLRAWAVTGLRARLHCSQAGSIYLATALVQIVQAISGGTRVADNLNQGHIDYFFLTLAVLQVIALVAFVFIAKRFRYRTVHHDLAVLDPVALEMAPDGRGAMFFTLSITRSIWRDVGALAPAGSKDHALGRCSIIAGAAAASSFPRHPPPPSKSSSEGCTARGHALCFLMVRDLAMTACQEI